MASSVNLVMLLGHLGMDPETRFTRDGSPVVRMRLATSRRVKNDKGGWDDVTDWFTLVAFDKVAETCGKYLRKGMQAHFEGRLETDTWTDKNTGQERQAVKVVVRTLTFVGKKDDAGGGRDRGQPQHQAAQAFEPSRGRGLQMDHDVPF